MRSFQQQTGTAVVFLGRGYGKGPWGAGGMCFRAGPKNFRNQATETPPLVNRIPSLWRWIGLLVWPGLWLMQAAGPAQAASEQLPPVVQWIPEDAVLVLEVTKPREILDVVMAPSVREKIETLPAWKQFQAAPNYRELRQLVEFLEKSLQTDWPTGVKKFFGGGLTVSVHPGGGVLLAVDSEDEGMLQQVHEIFRGIATLEAAKQKQPNRVKSTQYRGVTTWSFAPQEAHCLIGRRLLLTNKSELLKEVLDCRAEAKGPNLAGQAQYKTARQAASQECTARLYANLKALPGVPQAQKLLQTPSEPLSALLFAGLVESVRQSSWLGLTMQIEGDRAVLRAAVDGKPAPESIARFSIPAAHGGALPPVEVPRLLASVSLYRDLHGFYAAKDKLFPERTSGLIFFENMMGIFFTGRDLTEEVLGQLESQVRLVAAAQEYDPAIGTPEIQLPAFALIFPMKAPDKFSEVVEEAWQKALGLINFTRGQQAQPGLIMDKGIHGQTKYTVAYFSAKEEKNRKALDVRFNFRPTLARTGPYVILSSTEQLACDLIDALEKELKQTPDGRPPQTAGVHSLVELRGSQIGGLLRVNREALVRQNMVEKGNTRQQAEQEIDLLTTALSLVENLRLQIAAQTEGTQATLEAKFQIPQTLQSQQ